jgi:predicted metal-binding membrane protein
MEARADSEQPGAAWRMLDPRSTAVVVAPLVAVGLVGWYVTIRLAGNMPGMANDMAWPAFAVMWVGMMVAMMLPSIGPVVIAQRMAAEARGGGALVTVAFVGGYLMVWFLVGVVPLMTFLMLRNPPMDAQSVRWLQIAGGGVFVLAGAYQFTSWKSHCLRACRSPLGFVTRHNATGAGGAPRGGALYGAYCVGSCWALMAVLVVVGLMNVLWMVAIALVFLAEKNWRHGALVARVAGGAVAALGVVVVVTPSLLSTISR